MKRRKQNAPKWIRWLLRSDNKVTCFPNQSAASLLGIQLRNIWNSSLRILAIYYTTIAAISIFRISQQPSRNQNFQWSKLSGYEISWKTDAHIWKGSMFVVLLTASTKRDAVDGVFVLFNKCESCLHDLRYENHVIDSLKAPMLPWLQWPRNWRQLALSLTVWMKQEEYGDLWLCDSICLLLFY